MKLHHHTFGWLAVIAVVVLIAAQGWAADSVDLFRAQYAAKEAKLEQTYSHVKIIETQTRGDESGHFMWTDRIKYLRDGDSVLSVSHALRSADPTWPVGTTGIVGGDEKKYFNIYKKLNKNSFVFQAFGPNPDLLASARIDCLPIFAPYCVLEQRVVDYLQQKNVRIVSATKATFNGQESIEVKTAQTTPDQGVKHAQFFFDPQSLALVGWTMPMMGDKQPKNRQFLWKETIGYTPGSNPPKIKKVNFWMVYPSEPGVKVWNHEANVVLVKFGPIPKKAFTLAAFGVKEPSLPKQASFPYWTAAINGIVFVVLGAFFAILAWRKKSRAKKSGGTPPAT